MSEKYSCLDCGTPAVTVDYDTGDGACAEHQRLPGLKCPICKRLSFDDGGGRACYGIPGPRGHEHPHAVCEETVLVEAQD